MQAASNDVADLSVIRDAGVVVDFLRSVANVLPDREIRALLGSVIVDGSESCVRVNSYGPRRNRIVV